METRPRVLILGGSFGGDYAALELDNLLARGVAFDNFFLFTPMLQDWTIDLCFAKDFACVTAGLPPRASAIDRPADLPARVA